MPINRRTRIRAHWTSLALALAVTLGCNSSTMKEPANSSKFDAPLRMKLADGAQAETAAPIKCFFQLAGPADERMKSKLKSAGLTIMALVDDVATVEGPADAIRAAAAHGFVKSVSLSQTRYPMKK